MPNHNEPPKVGITVLIPLDLLNKINTNISGKSQSAKIRTCIEIGYKAILNNGESGEPPSRSLAIPQKR